jgi:Thioredoxin
MSNNQGALARARKGSTSKHVGIAIFLFILVGVVGVLLYLGGGSAGTANADALAMCMKSKNITMYGAYWCPHCQAVKREFGSSFQYVPYVECTQEADRCNAANVTGYPTFTSADGTHILEGEATLDQLAAKTGCPGPNASSSASTITPGASSTAPSATSTDSTGSPQSFSPAISSTPVL